jgi:hypothetical protein
MKETIKISFWVIFAVTIGIALGHTLFIKVEPGWGMRDTSEIDHLEFYCIDKQALTFKVEIETLGKIECPVAVRNNVRIAFNERYITDKGAVDIIKQEVKYSTRNCAILRCKVDYPK